MQKSPAMTPEQLTDRLRAALGDRLKSVVLFGSAAAGDFVSGTSDLDLLVIAEPLGMSELNALMPSVGDWTAAGHEAPQLMTRAQLADSADAFPIELADLKQSRRVLYGENPVENLAVDRQHLRLQLERELKGKFLVLRRKYMLTGGRAEDIIELLTGSLSTFLVLFRGALRLFEDEPPMKKLDALERLKAHIAFDPRPFLTVNNLKESRRRLPDGEAQLLFADYLSQIELIVETVDRHLHPIP